MKNKSTLSHFWKAALGIALVLGSTSETIAQGTITISRPGNSMDYSHNGTSWIHENNSTYTYNSNGDLTLRVYLAPTTNQNLGKEEYAYDAHGNLSRNFNYNWQNNAWVFSGGQKDSLVYNSSNQVVSHYTSSSQGGTWTRLKTDKTYNASGELIEERSYSFDNGAWWPTIKKTITYSNSVITETLQESWNGTAWVNFLKETYSAWHVPNVEPATYTTQMFNAAINQWNWLDKYTITPTANGGYIRLTEKYQNNAWADYHRYTLAKDSRGNTVNELYERVINGAWVNLGENQTLITYNSAFDITEMTYRWLLPHAGQPAAGPPVDRYKEVYSNLQYFNRALGTLENAKAELGIKVYPNPATHKIQIEFADQKPQPFTVRVLDLTGKTCFTKAFKAAERKQLDIETLPKGIYLLQLQTESGIAVKRIVKQ